MTCIAHKQCPACAKLGADTSGDNLAVYDDGGEYCFACGYTKRADNRPSLRILHTNLYHKVVSEKEAIYGVSGTFSSRALAYLYQFGITDDEIVKYRLGHIENGIYEKNGYQIYVYDNLFFPLTPNCLDFVTKKIPPLIKNEPKNICSKNAKLYFTDSFCEERQTFLDGLFIVEDILSAITCARDIYSGSVSLLGNRLTKSKLLEFGNYLNSYQRIKNYSYDIRPRDQISYVYLWLDNDKGGNEYINELQSYINLLLPDATCKIIHSEKDPKYYSPEQIQEIVSK